VVGGGILGTMHAVFAVRRGATVLHFDRHERPRGASVRNFGLVWVSGRAPGGELILALRARELWEQLGHDVPGTGFRGNGSMTVVSSDAEVKVLEATAARADASERGLSLLDADEIRRANPGLHGDYLAGLHCSRDAAVEPHLTLGALRSWLEASGRYEFLAPREVFGLGDHAVIDSTGVRHRADLVVLCLGAVHNGPMGSLLEGTPLRPVRLQMMETEPLGRALTTSVVDGNSLRYYGAFRKFSTSMLGPQDEMLSRHGMQMICQQRLDGCLTLGDTHEYEQPFAFDISEEATSLVHQLAHKALGAPFPKIRRRWAGVYDQLVDVSDEELYLRREVPSGVIALTGVGGRGMTISPAVAEDTFR